MEIEITEIPPLQPGERSLIDMQPLLQVVAALEVELQVMGLHLVASPDLLAHSLALCREISTGLAQPKLALDFAVRISEFQPEVLNEVVAASAAYPVRAAQPSHRETVDNLRCAFSLLEMRAREILAEARTPGQWVCHPLATLQTDFLSLFAVRETTHHGRPRVLYRPAPAGPPDQQVEFVCRSLDQLSIALPLGLKEAIRGLIDNARRYTPAGGTLHLGLHETPAELRFLARDTGCGIPPEEIPGVVAGGRRGTNVRHLHTPGGGYGLTRAFLIARQHGGRLAIDSARGTGTAITLTLPRPAAASA